jgi:hypothetical protein
VVGNATLLTNIYFSPGCGASGVVDHRTKRHLSAKKTILDIRKSKRVLDNAFVAE